MRDLSTRGNTPSLYRSMGVVLVLVVCVKLAGCSAVGARPQLVTPRTVETPPTTAASSSPSIKETTLQTQSLHLQDLAVREEQGQSTLFVRLSSPVSEFRHFPLPQPARIVLDIFGDATQLAQPEVFRLDTHWLSTLRVGSIAGALRLTFDVAAATVPTYSVTAESGGIRIVVGSLAPNLTAKKAFMLVKEGKRTDVMGVESTLPAARDTKTPVPVGEQPPAGEKLYTGQKISFDFKDADIKNVFRLLAEVSGLNIVVTTDVTQKVTVRLTEVPWDQALDILVETHGLGKEQVGNVVRISTAAVLKAERDALAAAQKARQDLEPLQTTYLTVNYAKVRDLEPKIKTLLSKRPDAALVIDERSNTIMIRDLRRSIDEITTLVSRLDTRTPQVLIESNLIETTPTFARALGMQLEFTNPTTGISVSSQLRAENPLTETVGAAFAVIRSRLGPLADVRAALTAAEQEGKIRIISRPSVVTLNNVESTIASLRILRIALPASTNIASGTGAAAGTAVATEQVRVGIVLSVVPQVSRDGFILLNIRVKSSSLGTQSPGSVIPDELSREAVSNVLVRDGETVVIGGIMKDSQQESETGVPYLKDIPVLGWLFKRIREQKDFEELMVFITPRLTTAGSVDLPAAEELWRDHMKKTVGESAGDFPSPGTP